MGGYTMIRPKLPPVQRSRGMRDLLPAEMRAFRRVEDAFRGAATRWGYEEVRTPTIETYSLFTTAGGLTPQMLSRVYSFLDWDGWSGERVVLRPDSTIPVARAAAEAKLKLPARLFYVQNRFRFVESGDREDWQCGIEFLGAPDVLGDLEVAAVGCETLDALGMPPTVRLGHVGITRAVVDAAGEAGAGLAERVAAEGLGEIRACLGENPQLAALVDVATGADGGLPLLENLAALARAALPAALPAIEELSGVARALIDSGRQVIVDPALPRDFEYYTGVVFEFDSAGSPWGRGGRYSPGGEGTAATACGLGLEAGELAMHLATSTRPRQWVAVVPASAGDLGRALAVARALHRSGINAALAEAAAPGGLAVRVAGERLVAQTPDGEREMSALDDVVGLLVQFK
jgi:histidyl-tRNA synthetase